MLTLLTLHGFTDARPARAQIRARGAALAKAYAAGPCRFYERPQPPRISAWTIWIPFCHLIVLNEDWVRYASKEALDFVLSHELGHVVLGHARHARRWAGLRAEAEAQADDFAEAVTGIPRSIIRG